MLQRRQFDGRGQTDAVAGVVNTVLQQDFDGLEMKAQYGGAEGTHRREFTFGMFAGKDFERSNLSGFLDYTNRTAQQASDEPYTASDDRRSLFERVVEFLHVMTERRRIRRRDGAHGWQLLRDLGSAISPQSAWNLLQGVETLSLRIERHVQNAQEIAEWLDNHDDIASVNYSGLPSSPWYAAANRYAPKGVGAVLSFELKGGVEAGREFVNSLSLFSHLANIGDVRSLVIHPASTTHSQLTPEQQLTAGVTPGLVRLSVGLENIDDLKADLEQAFAAARRVSEAARA